jgi:hypothetical protein
MKRLQIKSTDLNSILTAMTVFNEHELVNIDYFFDYNSQLHIVSGVFGLLNNLKLKNRIDKIKLIASIPIEFEVIEIK